MPSAEAMNWKSVIKMKTEKELKEKLRELEQQHPSVFSENFAKIEILRWVLE